MLILPAARIAALTLLSLVAASTAYSQPRAQPGRLVIIGGGLEATNESVYRTILDGRLGNGPVCVFPTAAATPDSAMAGPVANFDKFGGANTATGILISEGKPETARDPALVAKIRGCSGFFFVGGIQSRVSRAFRPDGKSSPAYEALMARWREGAVVSGSSAGAAVMSDPMIAGGTSPGAMTAGVRPVSLALADADDPSDAVTLTTGLGFFPAALADQHFLARGRFGRLLVTLLDLEQFDLAFGVDENTALVVDGGTVWTAGASGVVVMDERGVQHDRRSANGVRVHLLGAGDRFDLAKRTITLTADKRPLTSPAAPVGDVAAPKDVFARWELLHLLDRFARSSQTELAIPASGGRITLRKTSAFRAVAKDGVGVQGAPAGLSMTGLTMDLVR